MGESFIETLKQRISLLTKNFEAQVLLFVIRENYLKTNALIRET